MDASRIDLINRAIPKAFRGYDRDAVDRLVQDLSDALAKATDEKLDCAARVKKLESALGEHREREETLRKSLVASRDMGEELRAAAQKEAHLILETARIKAGALLQNAGIRLARLKEETAALEKSKALLEMRLRNTLEEHLRLLDLEKETGERLEKTARNGLPGSGGAEDPA